MTAISVREPEDAKLRRAVESFAVPAFSSAAELQAWVNEVNAAASSLAEMRATLDVIKTKLQALTVSAELQRRGLR